MSFPSDLKYTNDHEWIRQSGSSASVGITGYALEQLGDVVHLELPKVGESFNAGDTFGTIESTKTVSDLYMPVSGKITKVNSTLVNNLESLAEDPYKGGWLVEIETTGAAEKLMTADQYEKFIAEE